MAAEGRVEELKRGTCKLIKAGSISPKFPNSISETHFINSEKASMEGYVSEGVC